MHVITEENSETIKELNALREELQKTKADIEKSKDLLAKERLVSAEARKFFRDIVELQVRSTLAFNEQLKDELTDIIQGIDYQLLRVMSIFKGETIQFMFHITPEIQVELQPVYNIQEKNYVYQIVKKDNREEKLTTETLSCIIKDKKGKETESEYFINTGMITERINETFTKTKTDLEKEEKNEVKLVQKQKSRSSNRS